MSETPTTDVVVEVRSLAKTFIANWTRKRTVAVDGISFQVRRGEVFGFLGPNGAGKTTTLKMLMGLLYPSQGEARLLGEAAGSLAAKSKTGYLPENPYFYDYLSAVEFLQMVGRIYGMSAPDCRARMDSLLDQVGLSMAKHRAMRSYSKGMLQRVGLAQALMSDPELVVLDEPMSGLDPIGRREVRDLIDSLRKRGKTVVFCTHILADAELLCDRVAIIVKGKIRQIGRLDELLGQNVHRVDLQWRAEPDVADKLCKLFPESRRSGEATWQYSTQGEKQAAQALRSVVQEGGQLISMTPHRPTLEEIFVRDASGPASELRS